MNKIIIAGGGTGGHIFPAIAIANAIKKQSPATEILFVGAKGTMEMEKVPQAGYKIVAIDIAGLNRSSLIKNIFLPYKLLKSFFQVAKIFSGFRPGAVIGVGGYSSFPVLKYAQQKGLPTYIHESNSFAGKSNIWLSKKAKKIFTASAGMENFFPANKIVVTGNPVRKEIVQSAVSKKEALQFFNLDAATTTILSIGGSLGAQSINEAIARHINEFTENNLQLIWQTGKPFKQKAEEVAKNLNNIYVSDFIMRMDMAYAAADLVISRSGAMAIAELSVVKKPAVFVPYPFAAENHQVANAKMLVNQNAALMVMNDDAATKLVAEVIALSKNEQRRNELKQNIGKLGVTNADDSIATQVLNDLN